MKKGYLCIAWVLLISQVSAYGYEYKDLPSPKEIIQSFGAVGDEYIEGYTIPKVLFKIGPGDTCRKSEPLQKLFKHNENISGYKTLFFDDEEQMRQLFIKYFPPEYIQAIDMLVPVAMKTDIWRFAILYLCGGVYGDLTQKFLVNPQEYVDHSHDQCVLSRFAVEPHQLAYLLHGTLTIGFMAMAPRQPYIKFVLDKIVENILNKKTCNSILDATGGHICLQHLNLWFSKPENDVLKYDGQYFFRGPDGEEYSISVPIHLPEIKGNYNIFLDSHKRQVIDRQRYKKNQMFKPTKLYSQLFKYRKHYMKFSPERIYQQNNK